MSRFLIIMGAIAFSFVSCQRELAPGGDVPSNQDVIPADFSWATTRNVNVTVGVPSVDGIASQFAIVRIYASPVLVAQNLVAKGVTKPSAVFRTTLALPSRATHIYVETTMPNGIKSVEMVEVQPQINAQGAVIGGGNVSVMSRAAVTRADNQITLPEAPVKYDKESDFDAKAIIRTAPSNGSQLGASWAFYAASRYFVPQGVTITADIDFNGNFQPYTDPVLYVAGKLTLPNVSMGKVHIVVLAGGEVTIEKISTNGTNLTTPAIYVFEGGKLTLGDKNINIGSKCVVNCGEVVFTNSANLNNSTRFYNTGKITTDEQIQLSNEATIYNAGVLEAAEIKVTGASTLYNYEGATLTVSDVLSMTNKESVLYQYGHATINEASKIQGTVYLNCYTVIDELDAEGATFKFGATAALEVAHAELNNSKVELASLSIFSAARYNTDKTGGRNTFTSTATAEQGLSVVNITEAYVRQGKESWFEGQMEVVSGDNIAEKYFSKGAVLRTEQTVVVPPCLCNGNVPPIVPEPEPEPTEEYELVKGLDITYCLEDTWPWLGDYDLNDVVVVTRIDRMLSKDGSKVKSLEVNWEVKAAGTRYKIAFALQLNDILRSQVEFVLSTHSGFGAGAFANAGIESGVASAVIPIFNSTSEVLSGTNTWVGTTPAPTKEYKTSISFSEPVAVAAIAKQNFFAAINGRGTEIHMPTFAPTEKAVLVDGNYLPSEPYKFYVAKGEQMINNNMMWMLAIPTTFRYPSESNDIRTVYENFLPWATSGGQLHQSWYLDDPDETKIYK